MQMPDPTYIYCSDVDDLFEFSESGAVDFCDERQVKCPGCTRLYTESQMLEYAEKRMGNLRAAKDAERYLWLRSRFDACAASCTFADDDSGKTWREVQQCDDAGSALDAAIDAAMVAANETLD